MLGWRSLALAAADPLAPAPTRARSGSPEGVVVGETSGVALDGWLAAHHLDCRESPSPRRTSVRAARLADGPVHHVSTDRVFPIPSEATSAREDASSCLQSVLGPPARTGDFPGSLDGPLVRATTSRRFADLSVDLT